MHVNILILFLLLHVHIVTCTVYTVTPDDHYYPNTTCHHCHNLQHYLLNITKYFTSNTQLLFLPGLHHLHTDLIIQNVHNISLIGSTANGTVIIQCNPSVSIVMTNITNLMLEDITIKNCKCDIHMNAAILIMDCTNVQWTKITVDSISSNGIIGINVLGDSCFSYIKSHMLSISYNDTQSAQNNSNHTVMIDHYIIINQLKGSPQPILSLKLLQYFYGVKFELTDTRIFGLTYQDAIINVIFEAKTECQNNFNIKNCQVTHNRITSVRNLLSISVSEPLITINNHIVQIENCLFSYNNGNNGSIIRLNGVIASVFISGCKFYNNRKLTMIFHAVIIPEILALKAKIFVVNTNFSSSSSHRSVDFAGVDLHLQGLVIFHNNTCNHSIIHLHESTISITNYTVFLANKAKMIISYSSKKYYYLALTENAIINVSHNTFVNFANTIKRLPKIPICYFQYFSKRKMDASHGNYSVIFDNNNEKYTLNAYNQLPIVHCRWLPQSIYDTTMPPTVNKQHIQFINSSGKFNMLPQLARLKILCYCSSNNDYDCYKEVLDPMYPGQTISVILINSRGSYGDETYKTNDVVVDTSSPMACLVTNLSEIKQSIGHSNCTELKYSIAFPSDNWCELYLRSSPGTNTQHTDIYYITQLPCPIGFFKNKGECQCDSSIKEFNIKCDINDQTILRPANSWTSATTHNNSYTYHISLHCPFHYCLPHSSHLNFSTPNSQCQFNRSGLLCGHCQQGLSTVFSSSYCQHCSNVYLLIIIPIAMAGVVLVLLLFVLNLTVTDGTINGFIVYVNIISINTPLFSTELHHFTPAYTFISLANLDLGIQTCFYSGMDDYAKMWLQLAFPFYLIFIATLIIVTSRYSTTIQRLTARRALPVLATLFLLSYTKILRIVCTVLFSYSTITHLPSKHTTLVWSMDANVPLFGVRFTILFIVCLILFLILVPFNVILLFTRTLSRFRFINKFKPLLDAYQGPYKNKYYYWTGLQLLIRIAFFGLSSLDRNINLIVCAMLLALFGGMYGMIQPFKNKVKNYQELVFILNLQGLYIILLHNYNFVVINIIIIMAAVHFIFIITYHVITYMFGGVIRNKIQLSVDTLTGWVTRLHNKLQPQQFHLQDFTRDSIPVAVDYHEYREPLIGQDY